MPRKPSKARIRAALAHYAEWRAKIDAAIPGSVPERARPYIIAMADEVRERIAAGEFGMCTTALSASVVREIKAWGSGYYKSLGPNGERYVS